MRDFANVRLTAIGPELDGFYRLGYVSVDASSDRDREAIAEAIAARWNAVADALAALENSGNRITAAHILRKALAGGGSE